MPLSKDPIMLGTSKQLFKHLEHQNTSENAAKQSPKAPTDNGCFLDSPLFRFAARHSNSMLHRIGCIPRSTVSYSSTGKDVLQHGQVISASQICTTLSMHVSWNTFRHWGHWTHDGTCSRTASVTRHIAQLSCVESPFGCR